MELIGKKKKTEDLIKALQKEHDELEKKAEEEAEKSVEKKSNLKGRISILKDKLQ